MGDCVRDELAMFFSSGAKPRSISKRGARHKSRACVT
jgi:hypothetical protein